MSTLQLEASSTENEAGTAVGEYASVNWVIRAGKWILKMKLAGITSVKCIADVPLLPLVTQKSVIVQKPVDQTLSL